MASDRKKKRIGFMILAAAVWMAACGKKEERNAPAEYGVRENDTSQGMDPEELQETDYSYIAEYTELGGGEFISFQDVCFAGDCLYYNQVFFDVVNQRNRPVLKQYSLTERRILRERDLIMAEEGGRRRQVLKYCVSENGNLYTVESVSSSERSGMRLLCAYDLDWNLRWEQDLISGPAGLNSSDQAEYIMTDGEERIYLGMRDAVCLFDSEGIYRKTAALGNEVLSGMWADRAGNVYVCLWNPSGRDETEYSLAEMHFEEGKTGKRSYSVFGGEAFSGGEEQNVLINNAGGLFRYDLSAQSRKEVLEWAACGLDGGDVEAVRTCGEGGFMVFCQDFRQGKSFLVELKRVETAMLPEKTEITIGCLKENDELQYAAAAFNRQSRSCHVILADYGRKEDGGKADIQDGVSALGIALSTGIKCPDILVLDDMEAYRMDVETMAEKGTFADLVPFLESSSLLKQEDYLENVLDCYRYNGQLIGIPCEISLKTMVGKNSELGQEPGWSLKEMMAYAAGHPKQQLFSGAVRSEVLQDCLIFGLDAFIDWDTGICRFDSEDFRELLNFAGGFPAVYDSQADGRSVGRKIREGDVLLYIAKIYDFYAIQEHQVMFDGQAVYIGYPGADGSGCIAEYSGGLALSAWSEHPEAAWEFMEFYIQMASDSRMRGGFHTRKSLLERQAEEAAAVAYYLDDKGNLLLDARGNPVPRELHGVQWSQEDEPIMFRCATEEEVSRIMELIKSARPAGTAGKEIMEMIREEAEPFFQGRKSAEEAADIIQSRVQNYLDER